MSKSIFSGLFSSENINECLEQVNDTDICEIVFHEVKVKTSESKKETYFAGDKVDDFLFDNELFYENNIFDDSFIKENISKIHPGLLLKTQEIDMETLLDIVEMHHSIKEICSLDKLNRHLNSDYVMKAQDMLGELFAYSIISRK